MMTVVWLFGQMVAVMGYSHYYLDKLYMTIWTVLSKCLNAWPDFFFFFLECLDFFIFFMFNSVLLNQCLNFGCT